MKKKNNKRAKKLTNIYDDHCPICQDLRKADEEEDITSEDLMRDDWEDHFDLLGYKNYV